MGKTYNVGDVVTIATQKYHRKGDKYRIIEVRGGGDNYVAVPDGVKPPYMLAYATTISHKEL